MHHRGSASTTGLEKRREGLAPATRHKLPTISHHRAKLLSIRPYISCCGRFTSPPGPGAWASPVLFKQGNDNDGRSSPPRPLYTAEERRRRDASPWTMVQGLLAPIQFAVFLISLCLVIRYLTTGEGLALATASIVLKTLLLYAIMITGSIWEREVFGRYLFARPFVWEDVFSILVLALHTAYLTALLTGALAVREQMMVALAAYAAYVVNATQFVLKLRAARRSCRIGDAGLAEPAQ
jgi:3-vinyl bacteriochlorophyllide hydratase